ncbi:MAG: hypothetical protein QOI78_1593, partial [Actinomycetota bacterium]|nr:hypothetical protein [Actinomycetota bacterium]
VTVHLCCLAWSWCHEVVPELVYLCDFSLTYPSRVPVSKAIAGLNRFATSKEFV